MKTFAEIIDGVVNQVLVMDMTDEDSLVWLKENVSNNDWIKTEVDGNIRGKYAGRGDEYHADIDSFVHKPFPSWVLDKSSKRYKAPKIRPDPKPEGFYYSWDEEKYDYVLVKGP